MKILDTDIFIAALRGDPAATAFIRGHMGQAATTVMTLAELYDGAAGSSRSGEGREGVEKILKGFPPLPFGPRHARIYGELAAARRRKSLPGGVFDIQIASVALAEGATVVTRNVRDFEGNEGLAVERW